MNGVGVSKLIEEWKRFFPLDVVDDWTSVPEGIEHDVPVVVGVMVGVNFIKCPSHYVLVSLEDESSEGKKFGQKFLFCSALILYKVFWSACSYLLKPVVK